MPADGTAPWRMCSPALRTRVRSRGTSIALPVEYSRCSRSTRSRLWRMVRRRATPAARSRRAMGGREKKKGRALGPAPILKESALREGGDCRLLAAVGGLGVRTRDDLPDLFVAPRRHVEHQQDLAFLQLLLEAL